MKEIKRYSPNTFNAVHASVAYLAYWAMNVVIGIVYAAILKGAGVAEDGYLTDYFGDMCISLLLMALGLFAVTAIMCLAARVKPVNGGGFLMRKGCGTEVLMAFVLIFGLCALFMPLAEAFSSDCEYIRHVGLGLPYPPAEIPDTMSVWALPLLILMPVLPAIFEELLFRGVILRGFLQFGKIPAVVLSALMFALAHGSYEQFIYQFLGGLAMGFLYVETKNIFVGMAAHFANNLFASWVLGIAYVCAGTGPSADVYISVVSVMFYLIGAVCLVSGFVYFGKKVLHGQKSPERSCEEVVATFVATDMVSGVLQEEKPWYDCGELSVKGGEVKNYLTPSGARVQVNKKSKAALPIVLSGVGIFIGVLFLALSFFTV